MKRAEAAVVARRGMAVLRTFSLGLATMLALSVAHSPAALADSKDGIFPTADQVGGQVYPEPLGPGQMFPTDIEVFDISGKPVDFSKLIAGKRTALAFFISAVPVSVNELQKLQDFAAKHAADVQVINLNADTVGTALEGGPARAVSATARTLAVIKKEQRLTNPIFVAPNDALSPKSISNRLGFRGLPTIFVVDAGGKVEKVFIGPQDWKKGDI